MTTVKEFARNVTHIATESSVRAWAKRYDLNEDAAVAEWEKQRREMLEYEKVLTCGLVAVPGYN